MQVDYCHLIVHYHGLIHFFIRIVITHGCILYLLPALCTSKEVEPTS